MLPDKARPLDRLHWSCQSCKQTSVKVLQDLDCYSAIAVRLYPTFCSQLLAGVSHLLNSGFNISGVTSPVHRAWLRMHPRWRGTCSSSASGQSRRTRYSACSTGLNGYCQSRCSTRQRSSSFWLLRATFYGHYMGRACYLLGCWDRTLSNRFVRTVQLQCPVTRQESCSC